MANNYYNLANSEMCENSPDVVNFQRFVQRRETVQQQQQDVPNSINSGYQESEPHMAFLKNLDPIPSRYFLFSFFFQLFFKINSNKKNYSLHVYLFIIMSA